MQKKYNHIPLSPGVYLMKDARGEILYIGKAANLRRRVSSYFLRLHPHTKPSYGVGAQDARIQKMVSEIAKIDYQKTDTAIEALILEANLIKKYQPSFNIKEKDDKSFLYVEITNEAWPRVLLVRGATKPNGERFGPFTSATQLKQALKILRKIFTWNTHSAQQIGKFNRPCFDYEISLCPGTCIGIITKKNYLKNIKNLKLFLSGRKAIIIKHLKREMKQESKTLNFEQAEKIKKQIFALQHIQDIALIKNDAQFFPPLKTAENLPPFEKGGLGGIFRIEGYDISNISGNSAVGAMVVFINDKPAKSEYRKFKIQTIKKADDVGMLKEILRRRFNNNWPLPDLILIDGGLGQVNAANQVLSEAGLKIPVVGLAKGPKRKADKIVGRIPSFANRETLTSLRDEAHRFAISYHKKVRGKKFLG